MNVSSLGPLAVLEPVAVGICDTQPVTIEGFRGVLEGCCDLRLAATASALDKALHSFVSEPPGVVIVDKAFGMPSVVEWVSDLSGLRPEVATVVWGGSVSEAEALRFLKAGARGVIRKTAPVAMVMSCLRAVAAGSTWMEEGLFGEPRRNDLFPRSELTQREKQVAELVQRGLKNREIGRELGICPGTVKIHLKHIFEKTGARGRYSLALSGLQARREQVPVFASLGG